MPLFDSAQYLHLTSGVSRLRPGTRWQRAEWVLSRALCRYRTFDFSEVPAAKRSAALRLQLSQFAPFTDPGYAVAWEGGSVAVWCWDQVVLRDALESQGMNATRVRVVPESACYPPLDDGVRLLKVAEGYEGQVWRARVLTNARFWVETPDAKQWLAFQRDAGVPPDAQRAQTTAADVERRDRPYTKLADGLEETNAATILEPALVFALVAILGICTAWYGIALVKLVVREDRLVEETKALETSAAPVLSAREKAIDNDLYMRQLARQSPYPDQLALIAAVASTYASDNAVLRDWNYAQGKVKFVIGYPNTVPSIAAAVAALQKQPDFDNVRAVPGGDPKSMSISADIKPRFPVNEESAPRG